MLHGFGQESGALASEKVRKNINIKRKIEGNEMT